MGVSRRRADRVRSHAAGRPAGAAARSHPPAADRDLHDRPVPGLGGLAILAAVLVSALPLPAGERRDARHHRRRDRDHVRRRGRRLRSRADSIHSSSWPGSSRRRRSRCAAGVFVDHLTLPFLDPIGLSDMARPGADAGGHCRGDERRELHRRRRRPRRRGVHDRRGDLRDHRALARPRRRRACSLRSPRARRWGSSAQLPPGLDLHGRRGVEPARPAARLRRHSGRAEDGRRRRPVLPVAILAVPALDATFVVAKRIKYRRPVYSADRWHFHHRFANIGFSQRRTVLYLYGWTLSLAALALAMRFVPYSDDDGTLNRGLGARHRGVRAGGAGVEPVPGGSCWRS